MSPLLDVLEPIEVRPAATRDPLALLRRAVDQAEQDVPAAALFAFLAGVQATLAARLAEAQAEQESNLITLEEAAELARVPVRRVKCWARRTGCTWIRRLGYRTVRIDGAAFRRWYASGRR